MEAYSIARSNTWVSVGRRIGLGEGAAARLGQFGHLGQHFAFELLRHRADRVDARAGQVFGTEFQHFHQPRLVQRRVGVGRAGQRGDAAGSGGEHFGFQRGAVLEAGFAQPHRQVDQAGTDDEAGRVEGAVGVEIGRRVAVADDLARRHEYVGDFVARVHRVDHAAVFDMDFHAFPVPASKAITAIRTAMP